MSEQEQLALDPLQRDLLLEQIEVFARAAAEGPARAEYEALREAVAAMAVGPLLVARLEAILEVLLAGERLRRTRGPGAHMALLALFQKTPRGRQRAEEIAALNGALRKLAGERIAELSASQRAPGAYALTLETESCRMVIRFDPEGARVESLEVG